MHIAWEEGEEEEKEGKRRRKGKSRGVPSLRYLAMRQTLADQRYLRPELFKDVPWFMAEEMWDCLGRWLVLFSFSYYLFPIHPDGLLTD